MAKKFYVVWAGRQPGIYTDWPTCQQQIDKFKGARYKSFKTRAEADAAFRSGKAPATPPKPAATRRRAGSGLATCTADEVRDHTARTKIFTDGGCEPNPGQAASGIAIYRDNRLAELWFGQYTPHGTNNTAELNGLHQAMLLAEKEDAARVAIYCDSKYAIQCITQWATKWERNGWRKPGGEIKNLELIQTMFALYQKLGKSIEVLHVNGHVGVEGNELADRMSIHGIDQKETGLQSYSVPENIAAIMEMRKG